MSVAERLAAIRARLDATFAPLPDDARMDAYYYGFDRTHVGSVDAILSAVAIAGKGSHSTDSWAGYDGYDTDYYRGWPGLPDAASAADLIQAGANQAAERVGAVATDLTALLGAVEGVLDLEIEEVADCLARSRGHTKALSGGDDYRAADSILAMIHAGIEEALA